MKKILCFVISLVCAICFFTQGASAVEILIEEKDVPSDIAQYLPDGIWDISAEEILDTIDTSTALGTVISVISAVFPEAMKAFLGLLGLLVISSVMASLVIQWQHPLSVHFWKRFHSFA